MGVGRLFSWYSESSGRSRKLAGNIAVSLVAKSISIICSLLIVPLTMEYVNPTRYGIWMTLSSTVAWISFFDLGLGNGLRNRFAEAKANGNDELARSYVSTTYVSLSFLVAVILCVLLTVNNYVDWPAFLNLDHSYYHELKVIFAILGVFFSVNMVVSLFSTVATANQSPGVSAIINAVGQVCSLIAVSALVRFSEGSLLNLAVYYSGIPCIVMTVASVIAYRSKHYSAYAPSFRYFRFKYVKDILNLGITFLFICMSLLLIFQIANLVLMRECGAETVTQYNIAYKYYNVLYSAFIIVLTPFWSAFTDAYTKRDISWMKNTLHKLELMALLGVAVALVMLLASPLAYKLWIQGKTEIPFSLTGAMMLYMSSCIVSNTYMYMINGIGTLKIQLYIYVFFAVVSWPLMTLAARSFGVYGVLILPTLVYFVQAVFARIQLKKLIDGTAAGLWIK